jgi:Flp pilus assembly protein TadG
MLFARFIKDRKGTIAPFMAIAAIPLAGLAGAAVDYSRANTVRTAMQSALDSIGLMLSKEASDLTAAELSSKTSTYFKAVFDRPEAQNLQLTPTLTSPQQGSFQLNLTASATVSTTFAAMLGVSQVEVGANAQIVWGIRKLNLALALDNTGSMSSSGKMTALKEAAHNLLTTLKGAESVPGDIKVSIIPFAVDVNVNKANVDADWIDWADWDAQNGTCSNNNYSTKSSCESNNRTWTPTSHSNWNGCVKDRDQNNDVTNTATNSGAATKYRAHQASACPAAMMPLSSDWTALNDKIDAMAPAGNTNVTIGLQMAWQTLTATAPFNAPAEAPDIDKVLVLLTDGENTQNRWTNSTSSIDARTEKACDNLRTANIKVYTVRVISGNATLLKNCATKPDMYYDVDEAAQLNSVFSSIAQNLANLRITR